LVWNRDEDDLGQKSIQYFRPFHLYANGFTEIKNGSCFIPKILSSLRPADDFRQRIASAPCPSSRRPLSPSPHYRKLRVLWLLVLILQQSLCAQSAHSRRTSIVQQTIDEHCLYDVTGTMTSRSCMTRMCRLRLRYVWETMREIKVFVGYPRE